MNANRCIDFEIGQKVLSYDLLDADEKRVMDAHLEACAACRDLRQQTFGREGALAELNWRAWRLMRRQNVPGHWWVAQRLRDLWPPFLLVFIVLAVIGLFLVMRGPERESVRILRLAVSRGATLDSTATPHIDHGPNALVLRTDREARAYVYELRQGTMRRLVPHEGGTPPELAAGETREMPLPQLEHHESRVLLVLVPRNADGTTEEWDAAVFTRLGRGGTDPGGRWPGGVRPTLRWYP